MNLYLTTTKFFYIKRLRNKLVIVVRVWGKLLQEKGAPLNTFYRIYLSPSS